MNLDFLEDYCCEGGAKEKSKESVKDKVSDKESSIWDTLTSWRPTYSQKQADKVLGEFEKQVDKYVEEQKVYPTNEEIYDAYQTALTQVLYSFADPLRDKDQTVLPYAPSLDKKTGEWKIDYNKVFNWSYLVLEELQDILEQYGMEIPSDSDVNKLLNSINYKITGNRSYELRYAPVLRLYDYYLHEFNTFSNSKDLKALLSALTATDKQADEVLLNSIKAYQILESKRPEEVNKEPTVKELIKESNVPKRSGGKYSGFISGGMKGGKKCGGNNTVLEIQNQMSENPIPLNIGTDPYLVKYETPNISLIHAQQTDALHKLNFYNKYQGDINKAIKMKEKRIELKTPNVSNKEQTFKNKMNRIEAVKKLKEIQKMSQGF